MYTKQEVSPNRREERNASLFFRASLFAVIVGAIMLVITDIFFGGLSRIGLSLLSIGALTNASYTLLEILKKEKDMKRGQL